MPDAQAPARPSDNAAAAREPVLTMLADVRPEMRVVRDEVLGARRGLYTRSLETAIRAARRLRSGGVVVNGSSTWRTDQLRHGGAKDSGIGREGPRYAVREMTDQRLVVFDL